MLLVPAGNAAAIERPTLAVPADLPSHHGLLGVRIEAAGDTAVVVASTMHDSPAERAGLRPGDLILAADQYRITQPKDLSRFIGSLEPDTEVSLLVERPTEPSAVSERLAIPCMVTHVKRLYSLMNEHGTGSPAQDRPRHLRRLAAQDSLEITALSVVSPSHTRTLADLHRALAFESDRYGADLRLSDVQLALTRPLKVTAMADELSREVSGFTDLSAYLRLAAERLDLETDYGHAQDSNADTVALEMFNQSEWPKELTRELMVPFVRAHWHAESAFDNLSDEEHESLLRQVPALLTEFTRTRVLDEGDSSTTALHAGTLRLAKRVDTAALFAAARVLATLTEPAVMKRIRKAARSLPADEVVDLPRTFGGEFLFARETKRGWILIGGDGDNFYGEDAALIIDLGGDDIYLNNCGGTLFIAAEGEVTYEQQSAVGLLIDFDGNDEYVGNGWGSMGAAIGGVSFLIDLRGDDSYSGSWLTQGSAFGGVGVLWDQEGDDRYSARQPAQAAAFFGAGLLLDGSGTDQYAAAEQAQGFGGAAGFGLLYDRRGDDRYMADRGAPSSYGSAGIYQGWSQGVGCGFRRSASGGIGALIDGAGDDEYQAGNFSQGTGYFFGLGLLVDRDGDDRYRSSRYSQGSAAHQAAGCLLDINGDDEYFARQAANQGAAWDAAVGILEDRAGDDDYQGGGLAQGAASMNGVGVLFDWAGADRYQAVNGQGRGGSVEYGRDAFNLGILIDTGGGSDSYSEKGRGDNAEQDFSKVEKVSSKVGLFLDR